MFHGNDAIDVKTGDLLLFTPSAKHFYNRKKDNAPWIHRWVYFLPRA
ncbi:AraC family ligand binding domain-containing protein, partial [Vibrio parahaemolyticus]|nr:AraC family ligand binding domain-containing protein [Vibrio parahaemolyticus]